MPRKLPENLYLSMEAKNPLNLLNEHWTYPAILTASSLRIFDPKDIFNKVEEPMVLIEHDSFFFKTLESEGGFLSGEKDEVILDLTLDSIPLYIRLQRIENTLTESFIQLKVVTREEKRIQGLFELSERLNLVLEGTRLGMWDWNPVTNDVIFDERWAEMLGYSFREIEQKLETWSSKVHPDDLASCFEDIQAHMEGKTDFYENVHRMQHKDGTWRYILDRGRIVKRNSAGEVIRFTGTHTDITKEKNAEQNALRALDSKSKFFANMSHEIRTPMHGILGLTEYLLQTPLNPDQRSILKTVAESGESLLVIINDILDISKLEAGKVQLFPSIFEFKYFLHGILKLFSDRIRLKNLNESISIDPETPKYVFADKNRLRQIIANLISNAIKFTIQGSIDLSVKVLKKDEESHLIAIEVQDSGIGISEEFQKEIFQRFSQENSSKTVKIQGTGLGLSISKHLVELMNGSIVIQSKENQGTKAIVTIPFIEKLPKIESSNEIQNLLQHRYSILIIDDNKVNLLVAEKVLQQLQQKYTLKSNPTEAFDLIQKLAFDYIFVDLHMPEMTGFQFLAKAFELEDSGWKKPKMIALTADAFEETRVDCIKAGFDDFLSKPYGVKDISEVLRKHSQKID